MFRVGDAESLRERVAQKVGYGRGSRVTAVPVLLHSTLFYGTVLYRYLTICTINSLSQFRVTTGSAAFAE